MQLVANRFLETLGQKHAIHTLTGWPKREVGAGDWKRYLELRTGVCGYSWLVHPAYLLLDEAQEYHSDSELWAAFFKSIGGYGLQALFVMLFASYGSPDSSREGFYQKLHSTAPRP